MNTDNGGLQSTGSVSHFCRGNRRTEAFFYGSHHFIGWEYFIFFDITKSKLWCHKIDFLPSQNHEDFVISQIRFCDITDSILWYRKIDFLISQNHFLISKKSILWYQKVEFVISQNMGFVVKRRLIQFVFSTLWFNELENIGPFVCELSCRWLVAVSQLYTCWNLRISKIRIFSESTFND